MSTSADPDGSAAPPADGLIVERRSYTDPEVVALVARVQAEYVLRYGGPDETPMDPAQFEPPAGVFLLGSVAGQAVSCGGWRAHGGRPSASTEVP